MIDYIISILNAADFRQIFPLGAAPMRVSVSETSKLTSWPVEDGTMRSDHRVIDPIEIEMPIVMHGGVNRSLFDQLRQIFLRGDVLVIQTKMRTYDNMMVVEIPHEEMPDMQGAVMVSVRLKQFVTVAPEFGELPPSKVANENQSSTVQRGGQQTAPVAETAPERRRSSTLYRIAN